MKILLRVILLVGVVTAGVLTWNRKPPQSPSEPSSTDSTSKLNNLYPESETIEARTGDSVMPDEVDEFATVEKTEEQWRAQLTPEQFKVLRKHGTERAFTGPNWDNKDAGTYSCAGCGLPLFDAKTKYESGTGWPSFWDPLKETSIETQPDNSLFSRRTEVHCRRCKGHLGHVFEDGPEPTGLRYCMNGVSMRFEPAEQTSDKTDE
jgi:peptide-methionine (R)-S-oxide reductase